MSVCVFELFSFSLSLNVELSLPLLYVSVFRFVSSLELTA